MFQFNLLTVVLLAFGVIGWVSWVRSVVETAKAHKNLSYPLLSFLLCAGLSFAAGEGDVYKSVQIDFVLLALVELCFNLIIRVIVNIVARLGGVALSGNTPATDWTPDVTALTSGVNDHEQRIQALTDGLQTMRSNLQETIPTILDSIGKIQSQTVVTPPLVVPYEVKAVLSDPVVEVHVLDQPSGILADAPLVPTGRPLNPAGTA